MAHKTSFTTLPTPSSSYQFEYEFIQEGWRFQPEDGLEVRIYRVLPVPRHHDPAGAHSPDEFATSDHELSTSDPLISQILARTQASTAGASSTVSSAGAGAGAGAGTGTAAGTGAGAGPKPTLKNLPWIVELQAIAPEDAIPAAESRLAAWPTLLHRTYCLSRCIVGEGCAMASPVCELSVVHIRV